MLPFVTLKSSLVRPVTSSESVTVKSSVAEFVGPAGAVRLTVGAVRSLTIEPLAASLLFSAPSVAAPFATSTVTVPSAVGVRSNV